MDQQILRKKLRTQRDKLGYSQEYTGTLLGISQPAYSDIESGKTKITEKLFKDIKAVEGFEEFDLDQPEQDNISFGQTIVDKWPWGKPSLYIFISIIGLAGLDFVVRAPADIARGFDAGTNQNFNIISIIIGLILTLLLGLSIYWFFWLKKWWKGQAKSDKIVL